MLDETNDPQIEKTPDDPQFWEQFEVRDLALRIAEKMTAASEAYVIERPAAPGAPPITEVIGITLEEIPIPDISHLITEDDAPVDNIFSAKQQRLLVEPLYSSWQPGRPFLADANVGIFSSRHRQAIVPDMLLSLDVTVTQDWFAKENRSYFIWEFGKPPDLVLEIVSNLKGRETTEKPLSYAAMGIPYYVIYDPQRLLQDRALSLYELRGGQYDLKPDWRLDKIGLALTLWDGVFEAKEAQWLRWCDLQGALIPTGFERAEQERSRAERLTAQLRALGIDPDA